MGSPNRVTPTSAIVALERPPDCRWMGNRGCLHPAGERRIVRPWRLPAWIICETSFKERRVEQWAPGLYTVLFFTDEALALAAGHRPCGECRRRAFVAYRDAWSAATGEPVRTIRDVDRALHAARVDEHRRQRTHVRPWRDLPDGAYVRLDDGGAPAVVVGDAVHPWVDGAYVEPVPRPRRGEATVLTPSPTVDVLLQGYPVQIGAGPST